MTALQILLFAALPALTIVAALRDATTMTIPNWVSVALALLFLPAALAAGLTWPQIGLGFGLCLAGLVAGMAMFAMNWIGGGDAKLLAAVAPWMGLSAIGPFLLFTGLAGGALSILLIGARQAPLLAGLPMPNWLHRLLEPKGDIPYGLAIAAGALMAFPQSSLMLSTALV